MAVAVKPHTCGSARTGALRADENVVARSAVEDVLRTADQHVVSRPTRQQAMAWAANDDVIAGAAVGGELDAA
jgi:hypothetical protein